MRLLLDTHAAAWWWLGNNRLPPLVMKAIHEASEVAVSAVSVFEVVTKHRLGKWPEAASLVARLPALIADSSFSALPVTVAHSHAAGALAEGHRDPFDRLLVAQAQIEGFTVVTADPAFSLFAVPRLWTGAAS